MIIGEDFKFRDDFKTDTIPVEILTDPFKGVILRFTEVGVEELNDGTAKLRYQYELYEMGSHTEISLRNNQKFVEFAGLILNTIILEAAELDGADRESYIEESGEERIVHAKGSAVSQE
jgi:hypothetical protein